MDKVDKEVLDTWISGRLEVETHGPDIVARARPIPGPATPTEDYIPRKIRIRLSDEEKAYLLGAKRGGSFIHALGRGLARGLKVGGNLLLLALAGAGTAAAVGTASPLAIAGAGIAAAAGGIAPAMAAKKAVKVKTGQERNGLYSLLILAGQIILEGIKYLRERKG